MSSPVPPHSRRHPRRDPTIATTVRSRRRAAETNRLRPLYAELVGQDEVARHVPTREERDLVTEAQRQLDDYEEAQADEMNTQLNIEVAHDRPQQPEPQPEVLYHIAGTQERMAQLTTSLRANGMLGLAVEAWDDGVVHRRAGMRGADVESFVFATTPVLGAIPVHVLEKIIDGSLPRAFLGVQQDQALLDYFRKASKIAVVKAPCIYNRYHVDVWGRAQLVSEWVVVLEFVDRYIHPESYGLRDEFRGQLTWKLCMEFDNLILDPHAHDPVATRQREAQAFPNNIPACFTDAQKTPATLAPVARLVCYTDEERARHFSRRYLRKGEISEAYEEHYWETVSFTPKRTVEKFVNNLVEEFRNIPDALRGSTRLARAMSYVGYAKTLVSRLKDHEKHRNSSLLQCVFEAAFLLAYRKGWIDNFYQMRTFPTALIAVPESAAPAEMMMSVFANCYSETRGGYAHHNAGESSASVERLSIPEINFCARIIDQIMAVHYNYKVEVGKWIPRLKLIEQNARLRREMERLDALIEAREDEDTAAGGEQMQPEIPDGVDPAIVYELYQLAVGNLINEMVAPVLEYLVPTTPRYLAPPEHRYPLTTLSPLPALREETPGLQTTPPLHGGDDHRLTLEEGEEEYLMAGALQRFPEGGNDE